MSRLYNSRWKPDTVRMAFVDNGDCPFDVQLAARWLDHLCDLMTFLTSKTFTFDGIVTEGAAEQGV